MNLEKIIKQGQSYPYNFFYGNVLEVKEVFQSAEGIFLLGRTSEELELLWGVDNLADLQNQLKLITKKNKDLNFIFRFAGNLNDVLAREKTIEGWGFQAENTHVGYFHNNLAELPSAEAETNIDLLDEIDVDELLQLEKNIFISMNFTREELTNWIKNNDIILVYRAAGKIKGFIVLNLYGDNQESCFIRNLGVSKQERGRGIGKQLLLTGLNKAKERDVKKSMLWVDYHNTTARNLYEKVGFKLDQNEAEVVFRVS